MDNSNKTPLVTAVTKTIEPAKPATSFSGTTVSAKTAEPVKSTTSSGGATETASASVAPATRQTLAEREQQALKEMQELREKREAQLAESRRIEEENAAKALAEHRAWFELNSDKAPEYKQRLRTLIAASRTTAAAKEAQALADGIKLPGVSGRFVRIESPGPLMLAEVEVFSGGGGSISKGKNATQSGTYRGAVANRAVDGNTDGNYRANSVSHTGGNGSSWWEVDLGREETIDAISIWNRMDMQSEFLKDFTVQILKNDRAAAWSQKVNSIPKPSVSLKVE